MDVFLDSTTVREMTKKLTNEADCSRARTKSKVFKRRQRFRQAHTHNAPISRYTNPKVFRFTMVHYESLLKGYENAEPLPNRFNEDGKSLYNPPGPKSSAYDKFPEPIDNSINGFDFHGTS